VPLVFGGYLAFDPENVHLYKKKIKLRLLTKKLRTLMKVAAICQIDDYEPVLGKTPDGLSILRYIFGTDAGELYIIAFNLKQLNLMSQPGGNHQSFESNQFMTVEYLGSRLSPCSAIAYLDGGYLYYGSEQGDSFLIKLNAGDEKVVEKDRPYFTVVRTYTSIGFVNDLCMRY
jgi:Mono-functional DNA-alkylating methyl methanesulfonate N-term